MLTPLWLVAAASAAGIGIGSPSHGGVISGNPPSLLPGDLLPSGGELVGVPAGPLAAGDVIVLLNGSMATVTAGATVQWNVDLPVGLTPPPGMAMFPSWWPYQSWYRSRYLTPIKPILTEMVYRPNTKVYGRDRVVVYDERQGLRSNVPPDDVTDTLSVQITDDGMEALGAVVQGALPYPTLDTYLDDLAARVPSMPIASTDGLFCEPVVAGTDIASSALVTAGMAQAALMYTAFQNAGAGAAAFCVRQVPDVTDFEICAGRLEVEALDLAVGSVRDTTLQINPVTAGVTSEVTLQRVDTDLEGRLRDVRLRWASRPAPCTIFPIGNIADANIASNPVFGPWSECALDLDADTATTDRLEFDFIPGADPEMWHTERTVAAGSATLTGVSRTKRGTCGTAPFEAEFTNLLNEFRSPVSDALADAWDARSPDTGQAMALDHLFDDVSIGDIGLTDASLEAVVTTPIVPAVGGGMRFGWTTTVTADDPQIQSALPATMASALSNGPFWSDTGNRPGGAGFDMSVDISAAYINQILRVGSGNRLANMTLEPTWSDLNIAPVGGATSDSVIPLNAQSLGAWWIPVPELGNATLGIRMRRTLDPFVYMPIDGINPPPGEWPLTLHMGQLLVDVYEVSGPNPGKVWLTGAYDLRDDELVIDLPSSMRDPYLDIERTLPSYSFTVLDTAFTSCDRWPHPAVRNLFINNCERGIEGLLGSLVHQAVVGEIDAILDEVPTPSWFDAAGESSHAVQLQQTGRWQQTQRVTLFARFQ